MEHASIAAFARFALELLALGATPALILATQQAMGDETEHARLAFALATTYAGRQIGPGPLPIDGALGAVSPRATFATLLREGCIGETLAAVEAHEALTQTTDDAVRTALARIAADETRHAELSWRAARWLIETGDDTFRAWAKEEIARALAEHRAPTGTGANDGTPHSARHGLLSTVTRNALSQQTLRDLVVPCARALFEVEGEPRVDDRSFSRV
jgi:hypothetical protein